MSQYSLLNLGVAEILGYSRPWPVEFEDSRNADSPFRINAHVASA